MNPRTVCFCQPIFSMISAGGAVLALEQGDHLGGLAALAQPGAFLGFGGFLGLGSGLGRGGFLSLGCGGGLSFAAVGLFLALGRGPFFRLAVFFAGAFSGATCAPCAPTLASWVAFLIFSVVIFVRAVTTFITRRGHKQVDSSARKSNVRRWLGALAKRPGTHSLPTEFMYEIAEFIAACAGAH
jgi:hypothetical protein